MAIPIESDKPGLETAPAQICPNCGESLAGDYCHGCGQKKIHPNEFSAKRFIGRLLTEFIDLESNKIIKTLRVLVIKPGVLAQEFLQGRRGTFIGPVKLYLTFSALYFLFAWGALSDIRGGGSERAARSPAVVNVARQRGIDPRVLADKFYQRAEKYATALRFLSVLVSGLFLSALYFRMKKYYVEHLVFSLYYYSFDFLSKSVFALIFISVAAIGWRLPSTVLNLFYPLALVYLIFALRKVYQQSWVMTLLKGLVLFGLETLLFIAVNIIGFIIAFTFA